MCFCFSFCVVFVLIIAVILFSFIVLFPVFPFSFRVVLQIATPEQSEPPNPTGVRGKMEALPGPVSGDSNLFVIQRPILHSDYGTVGPVRDKHPCIQR